MTRALDAARGYAARGLEVFPLRGKMPAISTHDGGHGLHDATTDDAQLIEWFDFPPNGSDFTNIGIAIPKNVIVMDVDTQHDGDEVFKAWVAEHGNDWVKRAPRQRTGNGGIHAWFWHPGPLPRYKHPDFHGIELGRIGRYVIGAPSVHPNGIVYKWEIGLPESAEQFAHMPTLPEWLIEAFKEPEIEIKDRGSATYTGEDPLDAAAHDFTSWSRLLGGHGWKLVRGDGDSDRSVWRHPTATGKQSATIRHGCLFVYSPNTPFPETTYNDPHGVTLYGGFATLEHAGDYSRASRVLRENGYLEDNSDKAFGDIDDMIQRSNEAKAATVASDPATPKPEELALPESKLGARIHWPEFWRQEEDLEARWLSEPIIAAERAHALYAGAKTGKSLLLLQVAAALATGRPFLDKRAHDPVGVLYADYEMTEEDLRQRLVQFGYGADDDLDPLNYYLLGAGQALDTVDGGLALMETAHDAGVKLVIIDTTARAVAGGENDADTLRAFYRCSGVGLKRLGIAWVRVDHSGKDAAKGQRGTSAKNDDVDVVWRLGPAGGEGAFNLEATHQRMGWVPRKVELQLANSHGAVQWMRRGSRIYGPGVRELAAEMKRVGVPVDASWRAAKDWLREHKVSFDNNLISDALAWRTEEETSAIFGGGSQ